ncbi:MAG: glycosyltransferase involved in cell wall biosynthesis [Psychroserpens sp.]|jgi:glycosyltransferase involved in cell wall biosynthesis
MKKITKVLHLTYDMRIGGTEMVIKNIIIGTDRSVFDMSIFCIESPIGPWGVDLRNSGIQIATSERKPGFDISLIFAIRKHLKKNKIDLIHCHQYTPWVYGVMAAFSTNTKVIFTEHGRFYPDSSSWKRKLINPWLCRITDYITAISKATKQALVDFEYIPEKRIDVIYNGIKKPDIIDEKLSELKKHLGLSPSTKILGTIARLDPIKNHKMMLSAFSIVLIAQPDTVLIIVGNGEEHGNIINHIKTLGLENKVIMPGYEPQPQHYLALMDLFLLSSLSEGTSMTLLEAMSLGKPCIVTDAGGNQEIIKNDVNGKVTINDDAEPFAKAIITIMQTPKIQHDMEEEALKRFKARFVVEKMAEQFSMIYHRLREP